MKSKFGKRGLQIKKKKKGDTYLSQIEGTSTLPPLELGSEIFSTFGFSESNDNDDDIEGNGGNDGNGGNYGNGGNGGNDGNEDDDPKTLLTTKSLRTLSSVTT